MRIRVCLSGFIFLMLLLGCASSKNTGNTDGEDDNYSTITITTLPSYLRTIPRLIVRGTGQNIEVYNSSIKSYQTDTRVLFIVNGMQLGRDFSDVTSSFINNNQTISVEFLKKAVATMRYGEAGRNGAIVIEAVEK